MKRRQPDDEICRQQRPPPHARHEGQRRQGQERLQRAECGHRAGNRGPEQGRPDQPAARRTAKHPLVPVTFGDPSGPGRGAYGEAPANLARPGWTTLARRASDARPPASQPTSGVRHSAWTATYTAAPTNAAAIIPALGPSGRPSQPGTTVAVSQAGPAITTAPAMNLASDGARRCVPRPPGPATFGPSSDPRPRRPIPTRPAPVRRARPDRGRAGSGSPCRGTWRPAASLSATATSCPSAHRTHRWRS